MSPGRVFLGGLLSSRKPLLRPAVVILHGEGKGVLCGCELVVVLGFSVGFPPFSCFFKFTVTLFENLFVLSLQAVPGSEISEWNCVVVTWL